MTYRGCGKTKGGRPRKHTPILSKGQFGMMEHLTSKGRIGKKVMRAHEIEARGKKLPEHVRKRKR